MDFISFLLIQYGESFGQPTNEWYSLNHKQYSMKIVEMKIKSKMIDMTVDGELYYGILNYICVPCECCDCQKTVELKLLNAALNISCFLLLLYFIML